MIDVLFVSARPTTGALALLTAKGATTERTGGEPDARGLQAAALLARFEGEAGTLAEHVDSSGAPRRMLLVGTGGGSEHDMVKAGSALTARLLVSGDVEVALDAARLTPAQSVALLEGAVLRSWRHDTYRTKLPEAQKPTLKQITLVSAPDGTEAAWARRAAVARGVAFTRALVTEPANVISPESFVDRCRALTELGIEIEVLGEDAMRELGIRNYWA